MHNVTEAMMPFASTTPYFRFDAQISRASGRTEQWPTQILELAALGVVKLSPFDDNGVCRQVDAPCQCCRCAKHLTKFIYTKL